MIEKGSQSEFLRWRAMIWNRINFQHTEIENETHGIISYLAADISKVFNELMGDVEDLYRNDRIHQIQSTMTKATVLARMFLKQRTRYQFEFPKALFKQPARFNSETMCDLHGEEKPEWNGKFVEFAISPTITKLGDENGENVSGLAYRISVHAGLC